MRIPQDVPNSRFVNQRRRRWILIIVAAAIVILLISATSLSYLYTDGLWFASIGQQRVFSTLFLVKAGLFASFGAVFFVALWINLLICDRLGVVDPLSPPEDELVQRYQRLIRPYAGRAYAVLSLVLALIVASGAIGEWQNWLLFRNGGNFGVQDPIFHKDVGFYVFRLPFISFVVNWTLAILFVILVVSAVFHYLNGGIRSQRVSPRVRSGVKVHLSVLLALIALVKAVAYIIQKWQLVNATDAYVNGAGYTDVHARMPALTLLVFVSIFAAGILLYNIRRQGWILPILAIGIWAFVAIAVGVIYPAILQTFKVVPAQSSLEAPYIQNNIKATRAAYGLNNVKTASFAGSTSVTAQQVSNAGPTLSNVRLWDPNSSITLQTFQKLQSLRSYYSFPALGVDRYTVNGQLTPVLVGVREVNASNLPSSSWVNEHLQYTHGEGVALSLANQVQSNGNPVFNIAGVPPSSSNGLPRITQPNVYFGLGESGYVVADTKQLEVDYQQANGTNVESHYTGNGGVPVGSIFTRAAFALRLGDINLLISSQLTSKSRIMFVRDPVAMAQKAAPFLSFGSHPYAVVVNGHIDWIINGYTTTSAYPYSQNADTQQVPPVTGLPSSYNYVRNSVKVVVNAFSGKMTFYAIDPQDPILRAYESAFPHMFTPMSKMSPQLQAHLRYPDDMFSIQAAIYGRYHLTNPAAFYSASDAWQLSLTDGAGAPTTSLAQVNTYNQQGQLVSTTAQRMSPIYQVMQIPGQANASFTISDAYVPAIEQSASTNAQNQNLSGFIIGGSDPGQYGQLYVYQTPQGVTGPVQADSEMQSNTAVSTQITYLDQHGSTVLLGNTLLLPIGQSVLYVRPMYVTSTTNSLPQLKDIIAVFGSRVSMEPTLPSALSHVLGVSVSSSAIGSSSVSTSNTTTPLSTSVAAQVQADLAKAASYYAAAQAALSSGSNGLGTYQSDINSMDAAISAAQKALTSSGGSGGASGGSGGGGSGAASGSGGSSGSGAASGSGGSSGSSGGGSTTTTTVPPTPTSGSVASPSGHRTRISA